MIEVLTRVPAAWRGRRLYDWGRRGLRARGCPRLPGTEGGWRVSFDPRWLDDFAVVPCPNGAVVRAARKRTDEVWVVLRRQGRLWRNDRYLIPARVALEVGWSLC